MACLFYHANTASISERGLSFKFPEFSALEREGIDILGDAAVSDNIVYLTNSSIEYDNLNQSSGRIVYSRSIQLSTMAKFSTHFVFSMDSNDSQGDGIAFFLSSEGYAYTIPQFKSEGLFGLVGDKHDVIPAVFAVAFDSLENIVGTIGQNFSHRRYLQQANVPDLHNGTVWNAWIDYNSQAQILKVYLASGSQSSKSHRNCVLSQRVNFSTYFRGNIKIGFSSAAVNSNETHIIFSWGFNSSTNGSEMSSKGKGRKKISTTTKIFLGVGSCIVAFIAGVLWVYFSFHRRKRAASITGQKLADMDLDSVLHHIPRRFKLDDLIAGTNNFREDQKLGQGGFGGVYKCNLVETNEIVAVKRISEGSRQGIKEFISEVSIVSRLRHRNLVQLLGWCHERDQLLLVYEYMPNGSLDRHIFRGGEKEATAEKKEPQVLQWSIRYKIASEIASALLYLHEGWDECVVHRDVKSSNILLDSNFSAKIGDFGLARMVAHERLAQTTQAAGTLGYLAPESVASGKTSPESDVYSFGAVALEIACGKKAIDVSLVEFDMRLVAWVWDLYGGDRLLEGADVRLNGGFEKEEMERLMVVGLWCSHPDAGSRPKMRQVVRLLNFEVAAPVLPPVMPVPSYSHTSITTEPSLSIVSQSLDITLSPR
ncbi:L-type lectin-domain containing receptor kinase IX.1-like [Cryptomeria japonica]|uniref:L-type lectin-domain containing receptor kinase IX.1-like n=1 Tax=Cryptomeria japonica TaxID=3369 RepID=UPI0027DA11AB|nr:L-type lectin-domain containing receptor kinase IX.1-like [Cryptomeria japonica]